MYNQAYHMLGYTVQFLVCLSFTETGTSSGFHTITKNLIDLKVKFSVTCNVFLLNSSAAK